MNWLNLNTSEQKELFAQASVKVNIPDFAIEKDAWVSLVLRILFNSEISEHIVFKGGTSLSKAYNLIERFSEDIDLSIDRSYLGFEGDLTKGEIRKLRRASHKFSLTTLSEILKQGFVSYGINNALFEITVPNTKISDQDPEVIHINYKSIFEETDYLRPRVLLEIGARALTEPYNTVKIQSLVDDNYPKAPFYEGFFDVNTIVPEKTFIEKLILLHEEFQKPEEKIRYKRMSRHLYDIFQIMQTEYSTSAINNNELFRNICNHREKFTPIRDVNYQELKLHDLSFLPTKAIKALYKSDYIEMQKSMIYGKSVSFDELIDKLNQFKNTIKEL